MKRKKLYRRKEYMPGKTRRGARFFVLCCFLVSLWYFFAAESLLSPTALYHPTKEILSLIDANAGRYGISKELLQAVILTESHYDSRAVSRTGALGVMQLMPETAEWVSEVSGLPDTDLADPAENIPLGAWYLDYLIGKYDGNLVLALAAYNAGHGNVDEWMETYGWAPDFAEISDIPFPETREFVRAVIESRDAFKEEAARKQADAAEKEAN